jgi:hypothetical protein
VKNVPLPGNQLASQMGFEDAPVLRNPKLNRRGKFWPDYGVARP